MSVHDRDHGDEAFLAEDASVSQRQLGDIADCGAVDKDVAGIDLSDDSCLSVLQVDDHAVLSDDRAVSRNACCDCQVAVGIQMPNFAMHRHDIARPDDVVAVEQLPRAGVPRCVD